MIFCPFTFRRGSIHPGFLLIGERRIIMAENEKIELVPVCEKYLLTVKEAAAYFNIGEKKIRRLAESNTGILAVYSGNRYLIIRPKFEEFILSSSEI